jgi:anti-sigma B factor antagonist
VIAVEGELDLSVADRIEEELAKAERREAEAIVLDLSEVTFIDSTGIAVLVAAARRSAENSDRLRIRRSNAPGVRRMLVLTGLDGRLPFVD